MRIVLIGYYGFGNWGDELSLLAVSRELVTCFHRHGTVLALSALTRTRSLPAGFPEELTPVPRRPWSGIRRELQRCDGVIVGGGSLLQDTSSLRSFLYYWILLGMASRAKKPVIFFRCGLGPFRRPLSRWLATRLMKRTVLFIARDQASAALANQLNCPLDRIQEGLDPVFSLFEPRSEPGSLHGRIAVFLRSTTPDREIMLREALGQLREQTGGLVECVGFHRELDRETVERIGQVTGGRTRYFESIEELKSYFLTLDCVFTMRLHPAVIASRLGIPWFAFDVDPKIVALCRWWNGQNLLRWEGLTRQSLVEAFRMREMIQQHTDRVKHQIDRSLPKEGTLCDAVFSVLARQSR